MRARGADILELAWYFLSQFSKEEQRDFEGFSVEAEEMLMAHGWPGNVREMQNTIRNLVVLNQGPIVEVDMLSTLTGRVPKVVREQSAIPLPAPQMQGSNLSDAGQSGTWPNLTLPLGQSFDTLSDS